MDTGEVKCPHCGSTETRATGSEQERGNGKRYADMICNNCDKSFWSHHPDAIAASRRVDRERSNPDEDRREKEHKKVVD